MNATRLIEGVTAAQPYRPGHESLADYHLRRIIGSPLPGPQKIAALRADYIGHVVGATEYTYSDGSRLRRSRDGTWSIPGERGPFDVVTLGEAR